MRRLIRIKLVRLQAEHARSRDGVQVEAVAIGLCHHAVVGNVRHDPQLELRVVGDDELLARWRNEDRTNEFDLGMFCMLGLELEKRPLFALAADTLKQDRAAACALGRSRHRFIRPGVIPTSTPTWTGSWDHKE